MNDLYRQKLEKENQELIKKLECLDRFMKLEEENRGLKSINTSLNRNLEDLVEKLKKQDKTIDYLEEVIKNPRRCDEYRMKSAYFETLQKHANKLVNDSYIPSMVEF